jgi:DNA polymerase III epsilon subunit-like protein
MPIILCFDTETTGKPPPSSDPRFKTEGFFNDKRTPAERWPRIVQLSFIVYDTDKLTMVEHYDQIVKMKPGVKIPLASTKVHGITDKMSERGIDIKNAMLDFMKACNKSSMIVGHNVQFDINVVCAELTLLIRNPSISFQEKKEFTALLKSMLYKENEKPKFCTMKNAKEVCNLPRHKYDPLTDKVMIDERGYFVIDETLDSKGKRQTRNPNLETTHKILFQQKPNGQLHNALVDVAVCLRVYVKLINNVDICDETHRASNKFIFNLIKPSRIQSNQLPARINDEPEVFKIRRMNDFTFNKKFKSEEELDLVGDEQSRSPSRKSRSKTRSYRRRNTKSASPFSRKNKTRRDRNSI